MKTAICITVLSMLSAHQLAFAGEATMTVDGFDRYQNLHARGTKRDMSRIRSGCVEGTLIAATEEIEASMRTLVKGDEVRISASSLNNSCQFLVRRIERL